MLLLSKRSALRYHHFIIIIFGCEILCINLAAEFNIGVLHGVQSMTWRNARHAVDEYNTHTRKSALLTGDGDLPTLGLVAPSDAFGLVEHRFCDIAQRHLVAIIVPSSTDLSLDEFRLVMSMCNRFHIPCIVDRSISEEFSKSDKSFVISVGLKADSIGKALAQLISRLMWNSFLLLYKQPQDVVKIADLLSVWHTDNGARTSIKLLQLPGDTSQYDAFLKHIRERLRQTNIIVHTDEVSTVHTLLARASLLNMTENRYSYLFTNLDLRLLEDFFVSMNAPYRCNISGIQLVKHSPLLKTDLALTMDSVFMTGEALSSMHRRMLAPETQALLCDAGDRWQDGELLNGILKKTRLKNLTTGNLDFDPKLSGVRTNVSLLGITRRSDGKFTQIGVWNDGDGVWKFEETYESKWKFRRFNNSDTPNLSGEKLRVVVYLEEPFVIRREGELKGTYYYEGFCIDLLQEMATALNFTFEIIEVEDGTYGVEDETGRWNGIIGVLQRHEADLSVSAVTITYSRVSVIDFTLPFMHLGIAILVGKNLDDPTQSTSSTLFTFLEPFSTKVWIALAIAYLSVASMMWLLAKLSPFEWYDDVQRLDKMDKKNASTKKLIKNQFNLLNSLWFAVGSLMQQGSDVIPRAAATRTVAVIWWMFTLILISSYTAQLAAFLTVERMTTPVESSADLANQQRIKFGTLRNGSTMDFFRESKIPIYERMWSMMQAGHPTVFVNSSKEGIARVKKGNYAYMMESSMLEFYMGSDCNLQTVGGLLDSKGYGVALPKGSPLRNVFSKTILQLQERTILEALKNKWWQGNQDMSNCPSQGPNSHSSLHRVFGIFYVLFAGILVALLMAIGEFCIESESQRQSLRLELTWLGRFFGWFHSIRNVSQSLGLGVNRSTRLEVAEQPRLYGSTHNCGGDSTPTVRHARFQQRKRPFREDSPRLARQAPNLPWAVTRIDDYSGAGNGRQSMDTVTMSTNITAPTSKVSTPRYQRKSSEPIRRKTSSIPMIFNKLSTPSIQLTMDPNDPDFNLQRLIPSSDELLLSRRMSITSNIAPNMAVSTAGQPARL